MNVAPSYILVNFFGSFLIYPYYLSQSNLNYYNLESSFVTNTTHNNLW